MSVTVVLPVVGPPTPPLPPRTATVGGGKILDHSSDDVDVKFLLFWFPRPPPRPPSTQGHRQESLGKDVETSRFRSPPAPIQTSWVGLATHSQGVLEGDGTSLAPARRRVPPQRLPEATPTRVPGAREARVVGLKTQKGRPFGSAQKGKGCSRI